MRRREMRRPTGPVEQPRDVEALERVIAALEGDVTSELDAHQRTMDVLVDALGLCYGAVWLPDGTGNFVLQVTQGGMAAVMADRWPAGEAMIEGAGYGGEALRRRTPVLMDAATSTASCPRWATAQAAGARQGCFLPVVEDNRVTAVLEYYGQNELPFFGGRAEKWQAISRLIAHARRSALTTA